MQMSKGIQYIKVDSLENQHLIDMVTFAFILCKINILDFKIYFEINILSIFYSKWYSFAELQNFFDYFNQMLLFKTWLRYIFSKNWNGLSVKHVVPAEQRLRHC